MRRYIYTEGRGRCDMYTAKQRNRGSWKQRRTQNPITTEKHKLGALGGGREGKGIAVCACVCVQRRRVVGKESVRRERRVRKGSPLLGRCCAPACCWVVHVLLRAKPHAAGQREPLLRRRRGGEVGRAVHLHGLKRGPKQGTGGHVEGQGGVVRAWGPAAAFSRRGKKMHTALLGWVETGK